MRKNPGLRFIAKRCLNSLWGRFSLRNNLTKTVITSDPAKIANLIYDHKLEILNIRELIPENETTHEEADDYDRITDLNAPG